ncbi:hypothetical protein [Gordonia rhizosphera]|nr:hypothetical protein [Gordonia rhizosphera]
MTTPDLLSCAPWATAPSAPDHCGASSNTNPIPDGTAPFLADR